MYQISVYSITPISLLGAAASIVTSWITLAANGKYRMDSRTTGPCSAIGKGQL